MLLPEEFKDRMKKLLGSEYEEFMLSYNKEKVQGLRINTLKLDVADKDRLPFKLDTVPWAYEGFYYNAEERPGRHPLHEAGVYYIQEPSAMSVASLLEPEEGSYICDMCAAPGGKSTHIAARLKGTGLEKLCQIQNSQRVPQIRLIRAEFKHRLPVTDHRIGRFRHRKSFRGKMLKNCRQHFLPCPKHILLGGKAHLKIQLVKLTGRAVRPCILIPKTGCHLEIPVKARRHKELFKLLGRLWQSIKLARMIPCRHQIIPGTFRGRTRKNRCRDLQKIMLRHALSDFCDNLAP